MHHVGFAEMAAPVSNAGGLGMITALTMPDAEALEKEIRKCRSMTDKPFGVNLTILPMFKDIDYKSYVDVVIQEDIKVVETAGRPPSEFIDDLKDAGIKIIHKCVTTRHAQSAVKMGADAISLDGFECAGHPGESDIGNFLLQVRRCMNTSVLSISPFGVQAESLWPLSHSRLGNGRARTGRPIRLLRWRWQRLTGLLPHLICISPARHTVMLSTHVTVGSCTGAWG